jgi:hypothetical protein
MRVPHCLLPSVLRHAVPQLQHKMSDFAATLCQVLQRRSLLPTLQPSGCPADPGFTSRFCGLGDLTPYSLPDHKILRTGPHIYI